MGRHVAPLARFKSKVFIDTLQISGKPELGPCWLWRGTIVQGYGQFHVDGKIVYAHKWYYEQLHGIVPFGLELDHLCRIRKCVNPEHLEQVSRQVNALRGISFVAENAKKTHCPNGHEYNLQNTHLYEGRRYCRVCNRNFYKQGA